MSKKATQFDLYSLEPEPEGKIAKEKLFHGWLVLGKTTVKDAKTRKELFDALQEEADKAPKCFDPRHGIRATHGGKTVDLVICFHCGHIYIYLDGKDERADSQTVSRDSQPAFDKVLKAAKVPLAKKKE